MSTGCRCWPCKSDAGGGPVRRRRQVKRAVGVGGDDWCVGGGGLARGVGHLAPVRARFVRSGRQVKCAAGGGGDGDRITPTVSQGSLGSQIFSRCFLSAMATASARLAAPILAQILRTWPLTPSREIPNWSAICLFEMPLVMESRMDF